MIKLFKPGFLLGLILLLAGNAWGLPVAGDVVKMWSYNNTATDFTEHYEMEGISGSSAGKFYNTFCVEKKEYFNNGSEYTVSSVTDYANKGGVDNDEDGDGWDDRDYISDVSIWLYASYFNGLFGRDYDMALIIQNAIWYEEDEISGDTILFGSTISEWYSAVTDDVTNFDVTGWNIKVINLAIYNDDGTISEYNQSQLVGAPVPEPATMVLFGIGLLGLARIGRKKTA